MLSYNDISIKLILNATACIHVCYINLKETLLYEVLTLANVIHKRNLAAWCQTAIPIVTILFTSCTPLNNSAGTFGSAWWLFLMFISAQHILHCFVEYSVYSVLLDICCVNRLDCTMWPVGSLIVQPLSNNLFLWLVFRIKWKFKT